MNSKGQPILSCLDTSKFEFNKSVKDWFKSINFNSQNDDACIAKEPEVFKPPVLPGQPVARDQMFCVMKHVLRLSWHV